MPMRRSERRGAKYGKVLGMGGVYDQENAAHYIGMGARFVLSGADHAYIMAGAAARTAFLRDVPLANGRLAEPAPAKEVAQEGLTAVRRKPAGFRLPAARLCC